MDSMMESEKATQVKFSRVVTMILVNIHHYLDQPVAVKVIDLKMLKC